MSRQDVSTLRQMNYITRLQNNPRSQITVREYLSSRGKEITNALTRSEASDLIKLLIFVRSH